MFTEDPARIPIHTRTVTYHGFLRPDGLWDIEGTLHDSKPYEQERRPAGAPIHHMRIRLTVDDAYTIRAVEADMPATPFGQECLPAVDPLQLLVGVTLGSGWRKAIAERMGREKGCTHLRELLFGMGTAAFQAVGPYRGRKQKEAGKPEPVMLKPRPPMGQCVGWSFDGAQIKRHYPQFVGWRTPAASVPDLD
jgi:hypothetical protein